MPEFVIEREVPGAGHFGTAEGQSISARSCGVLDELGPAIRWVQRYVVSDRIHCIDTACDGALVSEHARLTGIPADLVCSVHPVIGPTTAGTGVPTT